MPSPDLTYTQDGLFTRFYPETPQGIEAWNHMANHPAGHTHLNAIAPQVIKQLRQAGYTVQKKRTPKRCTKADIDHLFGQLINVGD